MFGRERTHKRANSKTTVPDASAMRLMDVVTKRVQPYLKLARVRWSLSGPWLLALWPFCWGAALATENGALPDWRIFAVLAMAARTLNCAGCTINDLWDKDFDAKVERSKQRPLVTGEVTCVQGWLFFGALNLLYVAILSQLEVFSLSSQFKVLIAIQLIINIIYPLSKRWTYWTAAILGVGVNWSIFLGWSAVKGPMTFSSPALPLALVYFAAWCWTHLYETIYGYQDLKDDVDAGVKSMAILLGNNTKLWFTSFGVAFVVSLSIAGYIAALGWPFYVGVAATTIHVGWQIATMDLRNPNDCSAKFLSNIWIGAFVYGGIAGAKILT